MILPNIDDLRKFGFIDYGTWNKYGNNSIKYNTMNQNVTNVLYAFATCDFVGYIGKTTKELNNRLKSHAKEAKKRINNYKYNKYNELYNCLKKGMNISILYYRPEGIVEYKGIVVDLVSGLEIPLQWIFKTRWTTVGYTEFKESTNSIANEILIHKIGIDCSVNPY